MISNELENYLILLTIRRAGKRRDALITGGVFLVSFVAMIALGMVDKLTGRTLYLTTAMTIVFGIGYLTTWLRFEIIKGSIELIETLLRME